MRLSSLVVACALAACGSSDGAGLDASAPADAAALDTALAPADASTAADGAPGPDATANVDAAAAPDGSASPACAAFESPALVVSAYPATGSGNINAGSQVVDVGGMDCAVVDAPLGVGAPGREQIIELTNLVAGTEYSVRIDGAADLAVYVATSCTGDAGPVVGECLLYQDTLSLTEVAAFTQPSFIGPIDGVAYVVVDYFSTTAPGNGNFNFAIDELRCTSSFDCPTIDAPVCEAFACVPGPADCESGEDPSPPEHGDDGPAGATALERDVSAAGAVCEQGEFESDFYRFSATAGEDLVVALAWTTSSADLDLIVYDADGAEVARSAGSSRPEAAAFIAPATGDYFARVFEFAGFGTPTTADPYTIVVHARECEWSGDCLDSSLPVCSDELKCVAGSDSCVADDPSPPENGDDGPVGALAVPAEVGAGPAVVGGSVCSVPIGGDSLGIERDYFRVDIGAGESLALELAWLVADELSFDLVDAVGTVVATPAPGASPRALTAADLPAGRYYVAVRKLSPLTSIASAYTLSIERSSP